MHTPSNACMRSCVLVYAKLAFLVVAVFATTACASIVTGFTNKLADDLSAAVLTNPDVAVVADGLPAYLLLVDALLESNPNDPAILNAAATLNSAYATGFVQDEARVKRFADKAKALALRATCLHNGSLCDLVRLRFDEFEAALAATAHDDIDFIYTLASSWATWVQVHADDFNAVAELPKARLLMERVIELDPTHAEGSPFIYMGVFATFLPAALGGQPEVGRENFERALEISQGKNLYAKTLMAEMYARAMFDRDLHDRLVDEVIAANPHASELTLQNVIAQELARELKESADEFF
ncbi:MAG: hypothetical protein F4W90_10810 [Gammaproteobacteria bacterium]|nr:hypothetical protein [Gammaproteobacteria bacterium]